MNPWLMLFQYLPSIIKAAEQLLPDATGLEKADAVVATATSIVGEVGDKLPALKDHISKIVDIYNSTDSTFGKIVAEVGAVESVVGDVTQVVGTVTNTTTGGVKVNLQPTAPTLTA